MLLLIALAHSRQLHAGGNSLTTPAGGGPIDVAVQWLLTSFVDGRAAPLFEILFGCGLVQMTRRHTGLGGDPAQARRLIRRRGAWLIVFGTIETGSVGTSITDCGGRHDALLLHSDNRLVATTAPFIADGIAARDLVFVHDPPDEVDLLRRAFDDAPGCPSMPVRTTTSA